MGSSIMESMKCHKWIILEKLGCGDIMKGVGKKAGILMSENGDQVQERENSLSASE
jgi:hypothetical protein